MILGRRRLLRIQDQRGRVRGLLDPLTGERFLIEERELRQAVEDDV